ncbi:TrkA C-terminal domain-containing protein [Candidatus Omnitrophota bacterium]
MIALFSLLAIIGLSIVVVRIGAIALELTGLSPEIASFQALSAFSGAGFTTTEAETLVTHPVRRRIIRILILLGSAGITTCIATLVLTFVRGTGQDALYKASTLAIGILILLLFARSAIIYRLMRKVISNALKKWTGLHVFDYEQILGLSQGYTISRIVVRHDCGMSNKKLSELKLEKDGVLVLAIYRKVNGKEKFIGGTTGDTLIKTQDVLICYSRQDAGKDLAEKCR